MAGKPRQAEETAVKNESLPSRQTKEKKTMDIRKFKELIAKREKIHPEDYLTIEHCDKEGAFKNLRGSHLSQKSLYT